MGVSASREEMVSQLLNDVIGAAEMRSGPLALKSDQVGKTTATGKPNNYDRFGFRIDLGNSADTVEDKVEKLRRQAEENMDQATEIEDIAQLEEREAKWNEAIANLRGKVPFTMTSDIKNLLRLGIPINLRVSIFSSWF